MDWTAVGSEVPEDLAKGLLFAVSTAAWRKGFSENHYLRSKLQGFRPAAIPAKMIDQIVLKGLKEDVACREFGVKKFAEENGALRRALETLGPDRAIEKLDELLERESVARVFWAAFAQGDTLAPIRDEVLSRLRAGALPKGAPMLPPRLERPPETKPEEVGLAPAPAPGDGDGAGAAAAAGGVHRAAADATEVEDLRERVRRAEKELARARDARERAQEDTRRLDEEAARLRGDRDRLAKALDDARRSLDDAETRSAGAASRAPSHEEERLRTALDEEKRRHVAASQRLKVLEREAEDWRKERQYRESLAQVPPYPRPPQLGGSGKAPEDKIVWNTAEHHYPRRMKPFLEKIARSEWIARVDIRDFEDSAETRVKSIDDQGNIYLLYSDGEKGVRIYLTTVGKDPNEGLWVAERLCELEPSIQPLKREPGAGVP